MADFHSTFRRYGGRLSLALLSGILLGVYARVPSLAFLPWVALVPWVLLYTDDRSGKVAYGYYVVGAWLAWVLQYPQPSRNAWFATPLLGLFFLPTWIPFAPVLRRLHLRYRLPRAVSVPLVWISVEWLRATLSVANFDLYRIGYSQARFPMLIQIADLTGVYGVSFLVAAFNGMLADVWFRLRDGGWSLASLRQRRLATTVAGVIGALVLTAGYGLVRLRAAESETGPRIAVVQPCTSHIPGHAIGDHLQQVLVTQQGVPDGDADLIVWPENAIFDNIRREGIYLEDLGWLASAKDALLLVGGMEWPLDRPGKKVNGAFLVDGDGRIVEQYDKQLLFPYTEYIPLDELLGRVSPTLHRLQRKLIRMSWGAAARAIPGESMTLFHLPWKGGALPFAALICSENTYPPLPAEAGRMGARFFVNITSEGNLGGPVQEQLVRICKFRAVENRIAYVRVGNTGISCFLDPQGRTRSVVRGTDGRVIQSVGVLIDEVPLSPGGTTPYARSRDAFALACVLVTALLYAASFVRRSRRSGRLPAGVGMIFAGVVGCVTAGCTGPPEIGSDPSVAAEALRSGRRNFEAGRPGEALRRFAVACGDPDVCRTSLLYAERIYEITNDVENAAEFFGAIAERYPSLAGEALGIRARFLERRGDPDEAEQEYLRSLERSPSYWVWESLGQLRMRRQEVDGAVDAFREAVRLAPRNAELRVNLARALRIRGDLGEAGEIVNALMDGDRAPASAFRELGWLSLASDRQVEAEAAFRGAVQRDPEDLESRLLLARMMLRRGDLEDATRGLEEIQRIQAERMRSRGGPGGAVARRGSLP